MSVYFVTGATGTIGSALVARLLGEPKTRVVALLRGDAVDAATTRLEQTLVPLQVDAEAARRDGRLRVVLGDAAVSEFGVGSGGYDDLLQACTHVVHCAGAVRMNLPLTAARRAGVDTTRNVLEFARRLKQAGMLRKVEMLSTVGVAGQAHPVLHEQWVGPTHLFHNTYEQAKAEAEADMQRALEQGLPITVHRPSMVVGDSRTGKALQFQVFYFIVEFLSGRRTHGIFPEFGDASLDIVPVDFVADAVVRSSHSPATTGRIFHLCAGPEEALSLGRLQELVRKSLQARGQRLPRAHHVPRGLFRGFVRGLSHVVDAKTKAALSTLPVFLDYLDTNQRFENDRSRAWLEEQHIVTPRTEAYVPRLLDYYFDRMNRGRTMRSENYHPPQT